MLLIACKKFLDKAIRVAKSSYTEVSIPEKPRIQLSRNKTLKFISSFRREGLHSKRAGVDSIFYRISSFVTGPRMHTFLERCKKSSGDVNRRKKMSLMKMKRKRIITLKSSSEFLSTIQFVSLRFPSILIPFSQTRCILNCGPLAFFYLHLPITAFLILLVHSPFLTTDSFS